MQKQKNFQLAVIGVLAFAVLFMSVGFAAYSSVLNINGTATVSGNKWSVHFVPASFQLADGSKTETSKTISDTSVEYTVDLEKPGDSYAFSIDVINDGTFGAKLNKITMTALTDAQKKYLTYEVIYDGITYQASADSLDIALPFATGANKKNVTVRVAYAAPTDPADLPETTQTVNLAVALDYSQAE